MAVDTVRAKSISGNQYDMARICFGKLVNRKSQTYYTRLWIIAEKQWTAGLVVMCVRVFFKWRGLTEGGIMKRKLDDDFKCGVCNSPFVMPI